MLGRNRRLMIHGHVIGHVMSRDRGEFAPRCETELSFFDNPDSHTFQLGQRTRITDIQLRVAI
jgi:hypothetical protein